jgi:hypothetical protein
VIVAVPGQPGLFRRGLGDAALDERRARLEARARELETLLGALRERTQPILDFFPGALDTRKYRSVWEVLSSIPRPGATDTFVRMSQEAGAQIIRAGIMSATDNIDLARTLLGMPPLLAVTDEQFAANIDRIVSLETSAWGAIEATGQFVDSVRAVTDAPAEAARAIGLGGWPMIALGVVAIVAQASLVYLVFERISNAVEVRIDAEAACRAESAAGRPCTGDQLLAYQARADERVARSGVVPAVSGAVRDVGEAAAGAISSASIIVGVGLLAGIYFLVQPAQLARARAAAADYGARASAAASRAASRARARFSRA